MCWFSVSGCYFNGLLNVREKTIMRSMANFAFHVSIICEFINKDAMKNIHDSWEKFKISTWKGIWKKFIPTLMGDFDGFKTSVGYVSTDVVGTSRELELEVEPGGGTESLQSHDQTLTDEELLLLMSKKVVS
ncbi:tigger transposable element-derived protein 1-like [Acinonyx jubatus]|uniref:Tigger transposable element-derived protein 1-like n=1 Tax=Acinonyx jubatus TaxID=32536 RepID=A0ABM3P4X3_ACIJB|nr:tigger transposable element-derived protein 1-like [Acinonyx jubatus]